MITVMGIVFLCLCTFFIDCVRRYTEYAVLDCLDETTYALTDAACFALMAIVWVGGLMCMGIVI